MYSCTQVLTHDNNAKRRRRRPRVGEGQTTNGVFYDGGLFLATLPVIIFYRVINPPVTDKFLNAGEGGGNGGHVTVRVCDRPHRDTSAAESCSG